MFKLWLYHDVMSLLIKNVEQAFQPVLSLHDGQPGKAVLLYYRDLTRRRVVSAVVDKSARIIDKLELDRVLAGGPA
jgi:hypothetical protein